MTDVNWAKAMFGCHAMHASCQVILQDQGVSDGGLHLVAAGVILASKEPLFSTAAMEAKCTHELIVGDLVIRPHGKWASSNFRGYGLAGLIKSSAMFPEGHELQTLDNGYQPKRMVRGAIAKSEGVA